MLHRRLQIFNNGYFIKRSPEHSAKRDQIRTREKRERGGRRKVRYVDTNDNFFYTVRSHGPTHGGGKGVREGGGGTEAHRIVSRFIAPLVWHNESTEMSNLLALSAHDEHRESDGRHGGASRIRRHQTRWWYFNPLTERNFPPLCIFLRPVFLSRVPKNKFRRCTTFDIRCK